MGGTDVRQTTIEREIRTTHVEHLRAAGNSVEHCYDTLNIGWSFDRVNNLEPIRLEF